MKAQNWHRIWIAFALLLTSVHAGRFADVSRRKGFAEQTVKDLHAPKLAERASSDRRFYSNATQSALAPQIPSPS